MSKTLFAAVAATLAFAMSAQASPAPAEDGQISLHVSLSDLDLSRQAGAIAAQKRITNAARSICGNETVLSGVARFYLYQSCVRSAVERTMPELNAQIAAEQRSRQLLLANRS